LLCGATRVAAFSIEKCSNSFGRKVMECGVGLDRVLIVGAGSVGKRHAANFQKLGYYISCVDPVESRVRELGEVADISSSYGSIEAAIASESLFAGAVICSPTKYHIAQAKLALESGINVLLEKPVGKTAKEAESLFPLYSSPPPGDPPEILVGYTWRWWPALKFIYNQVQKGSVGKVYFARFMISAHLADWHPWEDYRDFFMSSEDLGGGALLDESHWIDQMVWLFGMPTQVIGRIGKVSDLDITSDDSADILATYGHELTVSLHLDIYGRPHEKTIQIIGSEGVLNWSEDSNSVKITKVNGDPTVTEFSEDRNFMFFEVAQEFGKIMRGELSPTCTLSDGIAVLNVIDAIRESRFRRAVKPRIPKIC
jgi:predicted dehydrogenase